MFQELINEFGENPIFYKEFPDYEGLAFFNIEFKNNVMILKIPNAGGMVDINLSPIQENWVNEKIVKDLKNVNFSWGIWDTENLNDAIFILNRLKELTN